RAIAQANAKILHDFFATLKDTDVAPKINFTMVTGITRYALTSMDSGPNHLNDISLDSNYAGLCGFTLEEFDSLFGDRLETTLSRLKQAGRMESSASLDDLRASMLRWYDGYNWGDQTRVLNPYSILNFFDNNKFDSYWIQSGRPGHLTALIRARPMDFLEPKLESYLSADLRKSELTQLQAVPVLFHSGYLTIDKITNIPVVSQKTKEKETIESYSFRLPNHEVSSSYNKDCFSAVFGLKDANALETKGDDLRAAFLARDAQKVSAIFSDFFSPVSYHQRPKEEKTFHAFVQLLLMAMGFNIQSELPGAQSRLDLCLELPDGVYVIIELKYCQSQTKLKPAEEEEALAVAAIDLVSKEARNESLARLAKRKLDRIELFQIISEDSYDNATKEEKDTILAKAAMKSFPRVDTDKVLADTAKTHLSSEELQEALYMVGNKPSPSNDEIDSVLSKAAQKALKDITERDYQGLLRHKAKEIIDLGLAVYWHGSQVKAAFGTK
ncbi:MAG: AAA family ATPase, partial [Deltaproteobacteria bacterium]|nr:AAA family ATPase [Deltaproteobacteria bacterium]